MLNFGKFLVALVLGLMLGLSLLLTSSFAQTASPTHNAVATKAGVQTSAQWRHWGGCGFDGFCGGCWDGCWDGCW